MHSSYDSNLVKTLLSAHPDLKPSRSKLRRMEKSEFFHHAVAHSGIPTSYQLDTDQPANQHHVVQRQSVSRRLRLRLSKAWSKMCELTHKNSNYFPTSSDPGFHGARNIEGTWPTDTRGGRRSSSRHASQNNHYMSLGTRPNGGSTKESSTSPVEKPPQETLIAKIRNMSQSALEETLKTQPDYEPNQETLREDHFIQAMLIVKRGSSDLNTSVPRWAKMDTGSPVSLVREETLEGLGIVPFRFGSDPLTGLVQDAVVEPVGLESIFWFDPADTREKPQIFQTNFKVLPKGTTRAFDFLLGADWLRAAQLQLAREPRDGRHTQTQPSVLYLRVLNQMQ